MQVASFAALGLEALVVDRGLPLHSVHIHNDDAATRYLRVYDAASLGDVDPATDEPVFVVSVPADTVTEVRLGKSFRNGIVVGSADQAAAGGSAGTNVDVTVVYG